MITQAALFRIANALRNELVLVCPVDTGILKNSINVGPTERGLLISMVEYGKFVEFGSNPRTIRPTRKKALKFTAGGETVIVRSVRHPGIRPTYFVRNTILNKLPGIIQRELSR
ncbi:hypothetical protein LCGC14_2268950 [marine sediment metagenome]|uniref:Uncharacterized protein n=1 Tax=marine sediment metagenome TaxID=412755 RepID=A0A0F9CXJ9_9ZZZZ